MLVILVTIDSQGLKTSADVVEQTIRKNLADQVQVTTITVPMHLTSQNGRSKRSAAVNPQTDRCGYFFERLMAHTQLWAARHRILIPNPEWITEHVVTLIPRLTEIWHKTRTNQTALANSFPTLYHSYIGFTSPDYVARPAFLNFPEWLQWRNMRFKYCMTSDEEYRLEATRCGVHLCPSSVEGFGHYLNQARSMGALIVTTNAAPMNEFVDETCAILVDPVRTEIQNFAWRHFIDVVGFEKAIQTVLKMPTDTRHALGVNARRRYVLDRERFQSKLIDQVLRLTRTT